MLMKSYPKFLEMLNEADSEAKIKNVCDLLCKSTGLEYYLFGICSTSSLSTPQVNTLSNFPTEWLKSYSKENMQKHDPIVKYCFENTTPIRWDKIIHMEEYVDPIGIEIMQRAAENGLANGFSVPIRAPSGEFAIFSLATSSSDNIDERIHEAFPYGQLFGAKLFETYSSLNIKDSEAKTYKLTAREIECLFWACEGKTTWEISKIIKVTERTIIFHLTSATKKLGAVSRQHAVAKALISGLIKPIP